MSRLSSNSKSTEIYESLKNRGKYKNSVTMVKRNLDTELGNSMQNNMKLQVTTLNLSKRLGPTCRDEKMKCPIKTYRIYIPPLSSTQKKIPCIRSPTTGCSFETFVTTRVKRSRRACTLLSLPIVHLCFKL